MAEEIKEELFSVSTPTVLKVENIRGAVYVQAEDRDSIQVKATKYIDTGDAENTLLSFDQVSDTTVHLATRVPTKVASLFKKNRIRPCKVRYDILVPQDCSLELNCVSASAEVQGLHGEHKLELVSGDVVCKDLIGQLKINTVSGDLQASGLTGGLDITTVSGDISLVGTEPETLSLHSVSGDMHIETDRISEGFAAETISGDIRLILQPESALTVKMISFSGDLHSDFPVVRTHHRIGQREYQIQGGGPGIKIQSLSGDLHIHDKSGTHQSNSEDHPAEIDSMAILDRVANGELSVEGAIDALKE